ncbi:glycoside hydrolase superfamily [Lipomyces kononenkoae]
MAKSAVIFLLALVALLQIVLAQPVNVQKRHAHNLHRRKPDPVAEAQGDIVYVTVQATVTATAEAYENTADVVVVTAVVNQWGQPVDPSSTTTSTSTTSTSTSTTSTSTEPTTTSTSVADVDTVAAPPVATVAPAVSSSSSSADAVAASPVATPAPVAPAAPAVSSSSSSSSTAEAIATPPVAIAVAAVSSSSSSAAPAASSSSSSFSGAKGITYSPYNSDGSCKSTSQVASDVAQFGSYELIRTYGVDCNQVENVWAAISSSQKLFIGVFDVTALDSAISTISSAAATYGWDQVYTVNIGNELVNSGEYTAAQVVDFVNSARSQLRAAGYKGPVVTVDTFVAVIANPSLCAASDYAAVNCHPFFDGGVVAADSGSFVKTQIGRVSAVCPGQDVLITESGWPKQGQNNGVAVPSVANQKAAISSLVEYVADQLIEFTAFNDYWKTPGPFETEQYWGILDS